MPDSAFIDVSVPIRPGMIVYEGDPDVGITLASAIARGDLANVSRLDLGAHTGTHIDAPFHFIDGAAGVDQSPLDALIGAASVVDASGVEGDITAEVIDGLAIPERAERVIFKTTNSELWSRGSFENSWVGLQDDAAQLLVERGVRLVGIDYFLLPRARTRRRPTSRSSRRA